MESTQSPVSSSATTDGQPSLSSVLKTTEKILVARDPLKLIEEAEIDLVKLLRNLGRIAISAKLVAKDRDGDPVELGEDNKAQITATVAIFELAKLIKDKTTAVQVGIFNDPKIVEEANRVLALKNRMENVV